MKSIAIDMDNVIADLEMHYMNWYEKRFRIKLSKEDLQGIAELEAFPDKEAARQFLHTPGFFLTAPVMPGAQDALQKLYKDFDVYIVSAAMEFPQSLSEKFYWMQQHFPFISWKKIIFCGDKSKIGTDLMIDDHVRNLQIFSGRGILFTACHNIKINHQFRVNNWQEATTFLYSNCSSVTS